VVGLDITTGLPRIEELFEARPPKAQAVVSEISGVAEVTHNEEGGVIRVTSSDVFYDEYSLPPDWQLQVNDGQWVDVGDLLACATSEAETAPQAADLSTETQPVVARVSGEVIIEDGRLSIKYEEEEEREYIVPSTTHIRVQTGDLINAGQQLTDGSINPHDILNILGKEAVQQYLVDEVQKVYRSQGVNINDKHIETIVHQMLDKVRVDSSGDTELVVGQLVDRTYYEDINAKVLGITRASLSTDSWLSAASFQETTKVLTEAAIYGKVDRLFGLKENVIIVKLIPARSQVSEEEVPELPVGEEVGELTI
jgi:DNA-directed RNA polymerase subunit beta'